MAICYAWHYFKASWHANQRSAAEAKALAAPDVTSSFKLYDDDSKRDPKSRFDQLAGLWERSSIVLDGMARAAGAKYVHVLQPNQYYRTKRKFSTEEEKIAFGLNSGISYTKFPLETGYPLLVDGVAKLKQKGIAAFSATGIYDAELRAIYVDSCCHVNELGNMILGQFVAETILETLRGSRTKRETVNERPIAPE